jgi:hypothetical protein
MKKYIPILLLFSFLIAALPNAVLISVQKAAVSSSITTSNECFNPHVNYPAIEIEHCQTSGNIDSCVHQLFKKLAGSLANNTKTRINSALLCSSIVFPGLIALENNNLAHNYPSHNFW